MLLLEVHVRAVIFFFISKENFINYLKNRAILMRKENRLILQQIGQKKTGEETVLFSLAG